jgi:hypothetical protein
MAKLIVEDINEIELLTEATADGKKDLFIHGIFLQAECVNGNKRWYPKSIMEREVARYNKNFILKKRAYGELGHPPGPKVNETLISHLVTEIKQDGNNWVGKAKVLDTPNGRIVKALLEGGSVPGVSSRGLGSLKAHDSGKYNIIQDDFHLAVMIDVVAQASAPDAFVQGIMEGVEWIYDAARDSYAQKMVEPIREHLQDLNTREIQEQKLAIFEQFMLGLSQKA